MKKPIVIGVAPRRTMRRYKFRSPRLRGRTGRVRTRYPTPGAFASSLKTQCEDYLDNIVQVAGRTTDSTRTNNNCTGLFLSPLASGQADRTLANNGTLLACNIELTLRNQTTYAHQLRVSVVELITEDKPIESATQLDWLSTSHFDDFYKKQDSTAEDDTTIPFIGASGPKDYVAIYSAINTNKIRVLKTKWITLGTDDAGQSPFAGVHMYVPLRRLIDKDSTVLCSTPRNGGNVADTRYAYAKPVFLLIESFLPPGTVPSANNTHAFVAGKIKFAFKDK